MDHKNHYEQAFRAYLQSAGYCYVAVNESARSPFGNVTLKNLDFIVYGGGGSRLLVDIKGRRFPSGSPGRQRRVWENWCHEDDLRGLSRWCELFGTGYCGLLVFAYHVLPEIPMFSDTEDLWYWKEKRYLFRAVTVQDYRRHMRVRSPKWKTVNLSRSAFQEIVLPFRHFAQGPMRVGQDEEADWWDAAACSEAAHGLTAGG
ncbi:MAG: hypothetical protein KatS3mg105_3625 [Gemmatales bacterium]|nr:MAG: hypothetical protein KatS3mg105_3625 [Gemmatales bacterium]